MSQFCAPTTQHKRRTRGFESPYMALRGKAQGFECGGVVGRFLHVSRSFYFFSQMSHATARNFVERVQ